MLLQSQNGEIDVLPALPKEWSTGSFRGLRARGGIEVDAVWANGLLTKLTLRSREGSGLIRVRIPTGQSLTRGGQAVSGPTFEVNLKVGESVAMKASPTL